MINILKIFIKFCCIIYLLLININYAIAASPFPPCMDEDYPPYDALSTAIDTISAANAEIATSACATPPVPPDTIVLTSECTAAVAAAEPEITTAITTITDSVATISACFNKLNRQTIPMTACPYQKNMSDVSYMGLWALSALLGKGSGPYASQINKALQSDDSKDILTAGISSISDSISNKIQSLSDSIIDISADLDEAMASNPDIVSEVKTQEEAINGIVAPLHQDILPFLIQVNRASLCAKFLGKYCDQTIAAFCQ